MLYIHKVNCIFPQESFDVSVLQDPKPSVDNMLMAVEPKYAEIPRGILRRMGKAVRLGVGAALPMLSQHPGVNGVIIGTANGGMEDCIKFLNQIIQYDEGRLTPTNFVQSTPNAIASQIGLLTTNKGYNITHVHRGLAFEHALIDAYMRLRQFPQHTYLVGAIDEISSYNYNIDFLNGWYKGENINNSQLYDSKTAGSIAGEGAAMFLVNSTSKDAIAKIEAIHQFHTPTIKFDSNEISYFLDTYLNQDSNIDACLLGENGDSRLLPLYDEFESMLTNRISSETTVLRYKHLTGEYPTSTGLGVAAICHLFKNYDLVPYLLKSPGDIKAINRVLIYNSYQGRQHSLMLLKKIGD